MTSVAGNSDGAITLAALLDEVATFIERFVVQSEHHVTPEALWVAHCYAIDAAPAAAYLRITSAVEESGKTRLLEILGMLLGKRGISAVSVTPSALFRLRDRMGPVALLIDEIDQTLRDRKDDSARDLLAIINSGYRRSAQVLRNVGQAHEPKLFKAFGPAAIAGIGRLHPTTESRCIPIELERKLRGSGERFIEFLLEPEANSIAERLKQWADETTIERLRAATPMIPDGLRDRHVEVWWGLLAIAEEAGGAWPDRARNAAMALHLGRENATPSTRVLLLEHIRQAFDEAQSDRLATVELLRRLIANEEGPWGRWWGAELNRADEDHPPRAAPVALASNLKDFHVRPKTIKLTDGGTAKGYRRESFEDLWARYLPPVQGAVTDVTDVTEQVSTVTSPTVGDVTEGLEDPRLIDDELVAPLVRVARASRLGHDLYDGSAVELLADFLRAGGRADGAWASDPDALVRAMQTARPRLASAGLSFAADNGNVCMWIEPPGSNGDASKVGRGTRDAVTESLVKEGLGSLPGLAPGELSGDAQANEGTST